MSRLASPLKRLLVLLAFAALLLAVAFSWIHGQPRITVWTWSGLGHTRLSPLTSLFLFLQAQNTPQQNFSPGNGSGIAALGNPIGSYAFTLAGAQAALTAAGAQAGGGQGAFVKLPCTGPIGGLNTGTTTLSMPTEVYLVTDAPDCAVIDFSGTGGSGSGAVDFPAGSIGGGIFNVKIELFGNSGTPTGVTIEGSTASPTYQLQFANMTIGSEQTNSLGRGFVLTSTNNPSNIARSIFTGIYVSSGAQRMTAAVISNGDSFNTFKRVALSALINAGTAFQMTNSQSDNMEIEAHGEASTTSTGVTIAGGSSSGNNVLIGCDLGASPDKCINDTGGGGNRFIVLNFNNSALGTTVASDRVEHLGFTSGLLAQTYDYLSAINTTTNCSSSASPAVCGQAVAGSVVVAAAATTVTVNTSIVTANSQIFLQPDDSLGTKLGVTCNTTGTLLDAEPWVSARVAGTSFTITVNAAPTTNPECLSYYVVN